MNEQQACARIATLASDYRPLVGMMTADRVHEWVNQFPAAPRLPILRELAHVLERTYVSQLDWERFLAELLTTEKLVGESAEAFWRRVNFFRAQKRGNSQREMLEVFDGVLSSTFGFGVDDCGSDDGPWVYLDDAIFTATHVRWDLLDWLKSEAPQECVLHTIVVASHTGRLDYTDNQLKKAARESGKSLKTTWWRAKAFEARRGRDTEVLWPTELPGGDPHVQMLVDQLTALKFPPQLRTITTTAANGVFSGDGPRSVLEREFLIAGSRLKYELAPALKQNHWPLGYDVLKCMGFGSMLVTFRNCANNCPLALWCGDPWFPLFPRETN